LIVPQTGDPRFGEAVAVASYGPETMPDNRPSAP
jgi:hypothetical protein